MCAHVCFLCCFALISGGQLVGDHVNLTVISGDINNLTYKSQIIVNGLLVVTVWYRCSWQSADDAV